MKLTRRRFLIGTGVAGGGLVLGFSLQDPVPVPGTRRGTFQPNAWLQITPDNQVIFQMARAEMGQGVHTGMATLIGEELDFDPARMTIELAGVHPDFSLMMGQITGGSMSTRLSWDPLREAGAMARAMLIRAAAQHWNIHTDQITTDDGIVINRTTGDRLEYGRLADAAKTAGREDYRLKPAGEYKWIGKSAPRTDSYLKSTGKAVFGMDVLLPDMKIAVVVRPPQFGSRVQSWDPDSVREQAGVYRAFEIHSGIAIVADGYWQARKAAGALQVHWTQGPLAGLDSAAIRRDQKRALAEEKPHVLAETGDIERGFLEAASSLEAEYYTPFLHHATMEPQNATAVVHGETAEMWVPSQGPDLARAVAAHFSGLKQKNITVHSTFLGGGFGRRAYVDFAGEAIAIAKQIPGIPVKLIWSREDDMRHDFYRPANLHAVRGALNGKGEILAWEHRVAGSSIMKGYAPDMMSNILPSFVPVHIGRSLGRYAGKFIARRDPTLAEGAEIPYTAANLKISQVLSEQGIPVGFWRSVGHSHTAFAAESFMDEMAHAAGADPVDFRRHHLAGKPRHLAVLELATGKAAWGRPPTGISQGVAVHESFNSFVAMVIEVSVKGRRYTVERIVAAVDCGLVVNPDIVRAQTESAIVYGLSGCMKDTLTIKNGAVTQSNFHDLPVLRMDETPKIEVYPVNSTEPPSGIGEPGLPPVAPALANALFAATGKRLREIPLQLG